MKRLESAAPAIRYTWMFRTAALPFLFFGAVWIWRYGFTDYLPSQKPLALAAGAAALIVGGFLLVPKRWAIAVSALAAIVVGLSAAVFAPNSRGPAILFLAGLALACIVYATLAMRVLLTSRSPESPG